MAVSSDLLSSTLRAIRDKEVDELFKKTAFLDGARKMGGVEKETGGYQLVRPLSIEEHSSISQMVSGYEPVSLAVKDVLQPATYTWCDFVAPIVISQKEELENSGERAVVKIVEARMKSVMSLLKRELNKQILAGNSTVLTNFNSLNGVAVATGFLENAVIGSQTNVVGGISKATYSTTRGWQNQRETASSSFSVNGLNAMNNLYIGANQVAPSGETKLVIMSQAAMSNYKRALFANERYISEKTLDGGRMSLAFGGAMVEADLDMPINSGVGTNEFSAYFINFDGVKLVIHPDADFAVSDFEHIQGTTTRAAQIYFKGQLVGDHLGSLGVLVDADTWV